MPTGIPKSGRRNCKPRARRVEVMCETCGTVMSVIDSLKKKPRFCSHACFGKSIAKQDSHAEVVCNSCGKHYKKRKDHVKEKNYCSIDCCAKARTVNGAKWKDKEKIKKYMREYAQKNKEVFNRRAREWGKNNRAIKNANQRARRSTLGKVSAKEWEEICTSYGNRCVCCLSEKSLEMDHVIPVSLGGTTSIDNVQPLCRTCNAIKSTKAIDFRPLFLLNMKALHGIEILETGRRRRGI